MKKIIFISFIFYCSQIFAQQQALNVVMLSHWNDTLLEHCDQDQIWNDLTGWKDTVKNREYVIAGSCDSIYFFDITDPTKMIKCDVKDGHSHLCVNRDYETYSHYVYCVSDMVIGGTIGALQIFDLQYLPDSVHKVYENDTFSINSHTIFIEIKTKKIYLCGNQHKPGVASSMLILSIANPENPTYLGEIPTSEVCTYTHEVYVRNDTAFCSCAYNGLYIYDVRNPAKPVMISNITGYPYNGYNHSSWVDSSEKHLLFSDEVPNGLPMKMYDISDIRNPKFETVFNSHTGATPHNADWKGRYAWVSSYEDGVYCYDLIDPMHPKVAGYYDTYMKNPPGVYNGFHGCWGVYCFLPSGNIIASDISEGLFVLAPTTTLGIVDVVRNIFPPVSVYPNPFSQTFHISIISQFNENAVVTVFDMTCKIVLQKDLHFNAGENKFDFDELKNSKGLFFIEMTGNNFSQKLKLIKE